MTCSGCFCFSVSRMCNCARLPTTVLKAAIILAEVKLHSNSVHVYDVVIAHVISGDAQTNQQTESDAIFVRSRLVK